MNFLFVHDSDLFGFFPHDFIFCNPSNLFSMAREMKSWGRKIIQILFLHAFNKSYLFINREGKERKDFQKGETTKDCRSLLVAVCLVLLPTLWMLVLLLADCCSWSSWGDPALQSIRTSSFEFILFAEVFKLPNESFDSALGSHKKNARHHHC